MAIPNNYNFSLQDVANEIPGGQTSLQECIDLSSDSKFDSAYIGLKNSLRNFRNYNAFVPAISISPTSRNVSSGSTSLIVSVTSNTSWSVTDNASWLTPNTSFGTGNGNFTISIATNGTGSSRTGVVTVSISGSSATLTITQAIPSITTYPIDLGRNAQEINACFSPLNRYYISGSQFFSSASGIYTNSSGTNRASGPFYYSDGEVIRRWTGNSFSGSGSFCLSGPGDGGFE